MTAAPLPPYVQRFFTDRLLGQMRASPNTVASYRDTFRLLLRFASETRGVEPTDLTLAHLDAALVGRFLTDCEARRGNSARSRNTRLAAIRSFFRYVSLSEPQLLLHCQQIVAMPSKRYVRRPVDFLASDEIVALLAAPDVHGWFGRRDRTLLLVAIQTGLRVSEAVGLRWRDVELGTGAHVRCVGKGRKARATPLRRDSRDALAAWAEETGGFADAPVFPGRAGRALSRDAIERLVRKHAEAAARSCPSFSAKRITPHVLRHTAAMQLLQAGVDRTVIALWLGHESVETTQVYVHADIELKERAMARTRTTEAMEGRYRPPDDLLGFLESL
jgi:site-specific recombinase XerD